VEWVDGDRGLVNGMKGEEDVLEVEDRDEEEELELELELGRGGCRIAMAPPVMSRGGQGSVPLHILGLVEVV